jgi:hypothetical protein
MPQFLVEITEIGSYSYYIDAETAEDAKAQATQQYENEPYPQSLEYDETRVYVEKSAGGWEPAI